MKWLLPLFSASLLALSFWQSFLWWITLFALVPFFVFLEMLEKQNEHAKRDAFLGGWLIGFIFFALVFRFILNSFPGGWAGVHNALSALPLFAISWIGTSLFISLPFGLFGLFSLKFFKIFPFVTFPSLWVLSEYFRALLFSIFAWGPGATLGPHWTFGDLGYVFIDTPIVLWSRFVGLYGLSFLAVLANVFVLFLFKNKFRPIFPTVATFLFLILVPSLIFHKEPGINPLTVALVHTNTLLGSLSKSDFDSSWKKMIDEEKVLQQPDIVVFPENGVLFSSDLNDLLIQTIFPNKDKDGLIISSTNVTDKSGVREQLVYRNQNNKILSVQDKTFLIPGGEYLPSVLKIFLYFQDKTLLERFNVSRTRIPGDISEKPVPFGGTQIGALMCSGVVSPIFYRSLANKGAEILINSASQIAFHNDPFFLRQVATMARFQAISNARPFLQASNGGQSFFINSMGKMEKKTNSFSNQILRATFSPLKEVTLYTKLGDWLLVVAVLVLFVSTFRNRKFRLWDHTKLPFQHRNQGILDQKDSLYTGTKA